MAASRPWITKLGGKTRRWFPGSTRLTFNGHREQIPSGVRLRYRFHEPEDLRFTAPEPPRQV